MKVIFRTKKEILEEIEFSDITNEIADALEKKYDKKPIKKYELIFNKGVTVGQCHRLDDITDKMVSILTITI